MADDENAVWLFGGKTGENGEWEAQRRFISPEFNAIYRQGVIGPRHLKEAEFAVFLQAARAEERRAANQFKVWFRTDRSEGGDYGDVAMERISARAHSFDAETAYGIVRVFAAVMDDYYRARPKREMFVDTWQQSESILRTFRTSVPGFQLGDVAVDIATAGPAMAWMCTAIARDELWRHGLAGDRRDDSARLLSLPELESFTTILIRRLDRLKRDRLLELPRLGGVLYAIRESPWLTDAATAIINRLAGPRVSDADFLRFLEAMSGVVVSSDRGVYYTVSSKAVGGLVGEDEFESRWARLLKKKLPAALTLKRDHVARMMAEAKNW